MAEGRQLPDRETGESRESKEMADSVSRLGARDMRGAARARGPEE